MALRIPKFDLASFQAKAAQQMQDKAASPASAMVQQLMAASPVSANSSQGLGTAMGTPSGVNRGTAPGVSGGAAFKKFVDAIAKQESGGNYSAVNKSSGALGKYQIMPANIPSWSKAALGHSISTSKFLNSPELQEAVAGYKLKQYFRRYGAEGAAQAWYGGEGSVGKTSRSGGKGYPTVGGYSSAIKRRMGR